MGQQLTPIARNLLIINLIVFALQELFKIDFPLLFGLRYFESDYFRVWQIMTYMFVHANFFHFVGNMLGLLVFGPLIEMTIGSRRFLSYYMICGMGAGILNYAVMYGEVQIQKQAINTFQSNPSEEAFVQYLAAFEKEKYNRNVDKFNDYVEVNGVPASIELVKEMFYFKINESHTVGASGAIFGILIAIFLLFPNIELMLLFLPFPIKAKYLIGFYIIFEIYSGLGLAGMSNVAHFAHLGGALIGFLLIKYWRVRRQY
jgi:membrane associated rhomboid family serine protease